MFKKWNLSMQPINSLIIRIFNDNPRVEWLIVDENRNVVEGPQQSELNELSSFGKNHRVVVIVPGIDVVISNLSIPKRLRQSQLLKSIPFAVEEEVGEDLSALHFAIGKRQPDDTLTVAWSNHQTMQQWIERLQQASLQPEVFIPEPLTLPLNNDGWSVFLDHEVVLVRTGKHSGFSSDKHNFSQLLEIKLHELQDANEHAPDKIYIYNDSNKTLLTSEKIQSLKPEVAFDNNPVDLTTLATTINCNEPAINLLQGKYYSSTRQLKIKRFAIASAALVGLWLIILTGGNIAQYNSYNKQLTTYNQQIAKIYRSIYPDATKIVSPKTRIQQDLKKLGNAQQETGFLHLLMTTGEMINRTPSTKLESMDYQQQALSLTLQVDTFQRLEKLIGDLKAAGLQVTRDNATSQDKVIKAQLHVSF